MLIYNKKKNRFGQDERRTKRVWASETGDPSIKVGNELILIFKEYEELRKKAEKEKTTILQDPLYQKQQNLNIICISLIRAYRDYMKQLKEK